jgi:hypothetical protein
VAHKFLAELLNHNEVRGLLSDELFSVDVTQVAEWASIKRFGAKDGSDEPPPGCRDSERDFRGETHSNATHVSTTDPEAQLYKRGRARKQGSASSATRRWRTETGSSSPRGDEGAGTAERKAAEEMIVRCSPAFVASPWAATGPGRGFVHRRHARVQRDDTHRPECKRPTFRRRCPHHAASRLFSEPTNQEAHRGGAHGGGVAYFDTRQRSQDHVGSRSRRRSSANAKPRATPVARSLDRSRCPCSRQHRVEYATMVARCSAGSTDSRLIFAKSSLEPFQSMPEKFAQRWPRSEPCLKISPEHEGATSVLSGDKLSTFDSSVDRGAAEARGGVSRRCRACQNLPRGAIRHVER